MPIYIMREHVEKAYPGDKWKLKVSKMTDAQILAIFQRLRASGKINA